MAAKYEVTGTDYGKETEADELGNYLIDVTIGLHPLDNFTPDFSKTFAIISNNNMTGTAVDEQRKDEIAKWIININK